MTAAQTTGDLPARQPLAVLELDNVSKVLSLIHI